MALQAVIGAEAHGSGVGMRIDKDAMAIILVTDIRVEAIAASSRYARIRSYSHTR